MKIKFYIKSLTIVHSTTEQFNIEPKLYKCTIPAPYQWPMDQLQARLSYKSLIQKANINFVNVSYQEQCEWCQVIWTKY